MGPMTYLKAESASLALRMQIGLTQPLLLPIAQSLDNVGTLSAGSEVTSPCRSKSRQCPIHRGKQPGVLCSQREVWEVCTCVFPPEASLLLPRHVLLPLG